jgi:hypothetical protein
MNDLVSSGCEVFFSSSPGEMFGISSREVRYLSREALFSGNTGQCDMFLILEFRIILLVNFEANLPE